jgi:diguanylate cyclase (GGDEF)-like protein
VALAAELCGVPYAILAYASSNGEMLSIISQESKNVASFPVQYALAPPWGMEPYPQPATDYLLFPELWAEGVPHHWEGLIQEGFRFYAGFPLRDSQSQVVGTLSLLDKTPRLMTDNQIAVLQTIARQAGTLLNLEYQVGKLEAQVSQQSEETQSAYWQARYDHLTGLPNRTHFQERLEEIIQTDLATSGKLRKTHGILFIDLNRFKQINDTLGHATGDVLLREVASRFASCLRPDDMLARMGGDEFTVLLPHIAGGMYAANVAQMLIQALRRPILLQGQEYQVGASIGIATFPQDGRDTHTLLKNADIAMYQAKETGGFRHYSQEMNADGHRRLLQEGELRRAIERDELLLQYQPLVELSTGKVVGVEALARWRHPEWGQVPPAHFVELAEQADLIVPLGEWVLHRACLDAAQWRQVCPHLRVSVNLAARQIAHPSLLNIVTSALESANLSGDALGVELTETALCTTGDGTPEKLFALRRMGIRLFVDDFGTGYSSLAYLRRFPVDALKIDQSFVAGIGCDTPDNAIIRAISQLAQALGIQFIAEGVETEAQLEFLETVCCDIVQGYFVGRPMPIEALLEQLLGGSRAGRTVPKI